MEITKSISGLNAEISYTPTNLFKYKSEASDKRTFETTTFNQLKQIYSTGVPNIVTIKAVEKSQKLVANPAGQLHIVSQSNDTFTREIAYINISRDEFEQLMELYEDPQFKIGEYVNYHPFFQVELKLKTQQVDIKNLIVGEIVDNNTGEAITEIRYEPKNVNTLGTRDDDKITFEENFANIIRYSFEADPNIDRIRLIAQTDYIDNRSGIPASTIASYESNREDFEAIMENWDNYRYRIYEQMDYTSIFLLDLLSSSTIQTLEFGEASSIEAFYDEEYNRITKTIDTIEEDAVELIYGLFGYFEEVETIKIDFKLKLPADDDSESADGVHQIIHDAMVLEVERIEAERVNTETLENKQILYNFNVQWDSENKIYEKNLAESLWEEIYRGTGVDLQNIRSIDIPNEKEAIIEFNSCEFLEDCNKRKGKDTCGEDCVYDRLITMGNKTIFQIHPPYLNTLTFKLSRVTLDLSGNEEIEDFGEIVFEKDDNTNYWLQTEEDIEWFEDDDNLMIDCSDMCQI